MKKSIHHRLSASLFLLAATWASLPCRSAEFHIAPLGDDRNPGTPEQPFATLTHARDASDATVLRAFLEWRRQLARDAYRAHLRIGWVYAPQARDVLHVHALVAPHEAEPVELHAADLAAAWTWGSVDVQPVTEPIGAAAYLLKHTSLTEPDIRRGWDLNVACDRRNRCRRPNRRGGAACLFAPGAWST